MKLLSISTDRKIFDPTSSVAQRQIEYARSTEETHIIIFSGREYNETSLAPNLFVYPTRSKSRLMYAFDAIKLGKFIIQGRGITNITCQDSSLTAMAGTSLKKRFGLPLEIQVHTDIGSPYFPYNISNRIRKAMSLSYLPKADTIRVVSERIKNYLVLKLKIPAERVSVKPIAVDVAAVKNTPITIDLHKKYPQFSKIVLMASRITSEKNIGLAIEAWPQVLATHPTAGLLIVGEGTLKETLKAKVRDMGLSDSILFEPWADKATLYSYYKTADIFLNTSLFEGYGMTLVEAQAAGTKVVSTDVGVAREVGATITPFEVRGTAEAINNTL